MKTLLAALFAVAALSACGGPLEADEAAPSVATRSEALNTGAPPQVGLPSGYIVAESGGQTVTAQPKAALIDARLARLMGPEDRYLWEMWLNGGGGGGCHGK